MTSRRTSAVRRFAIGCGSSRDTSICATTTVSRAPIPQFPRTYEQDKIFAKLTWQLAPGWQLVQSMHDESWVNPEHPTFVKPFEATLRSHASVPAITFGDLTHTRRPIPLWDVRAGRFVYDREDDPSTGNRTTPSRFDRATGVSSGAPQTFGGLTLIRTTAKATLSHYRPGLCGADHQWKIGGQFERGEHHVPIGHSDGCEVRRRRRTAVSGHLERPLTRRRRRPSPPRRSRATPSRSGTG